MSESFNPLKHLSARKDAADNILWEYLERNGLPVLREGPDGLLHQVLVAKRYLPVNGYRQWFYSRYPEGSIFVEDITPGPVLAADRFVEYPFYKVLVTLFADQEHKRIISTGYGTYSKSKKYNPFEEKYSFVEGSESSDNYLLCQALAIKNAMANAGFIVDYTEDVLQAPDSQFLEFDYTMLEAVPSEKIPAQGKEMHASSPVISMEESLHEKTEQVSLPKTVLTPACADAPENPEAEQESAALDPVLAFLSAKEEKMLPPAAETSTAPETEKAEEPQPAALSPEEVIFQLAEGVAITPAMEAYIGKKIGEIEPSKISYFARKPNLSKLLSEETVKAIIAVA